MQNNLLNKTYELSNNLNISPEVLRTYIKSFCYDVFLRLRNENPDIHLNLMCKLGYDRY